MKPIVAAAALVFAALAQVTVASLFPWQAAVPDLVLVTLLVMAAFAGPTYVMAGLPLLALALGFASDRSPALWLLAYLPLLPAAAWLEESALPANRFSTWLGAGLFTGIWARLVLSLGAIAQGADAHAGLLAFDLLVPGLILDLLLISAAYLPLHAAGWQARSLSLEQGRF